MGSRRRRLNPVVRYQGYEMFRNIVQSSSGHMSGTVVYREGHATQHHVSCVKWYHNQFQEHGSNLVGIAHNVSHGFDSLRDRSMLEMTPIIEHIIPPRIATDISFFNILKNYAFGSDDTPTTNVYKTERVFAGLVSRKYIDKRFVSNISHFVRVISHKDSGVHIWNMNVAHTKSGIYKQNTYLCYKNQPQPWSLNIPVPRRTTTNTEFFAIIYSLWKVFLTTLPYLLPNQPNSCVSFRVGVFSNRYSVMNREGSIVDGEGSEVQPDYTSRVFYVRLSRSGDIMLQVCLYIAKSLADEISDIFVEKYRHEEEEDRFQDENGAIRYIQVSAGTYYGANQVLSSKVFGSPKTTQLLDNIIDGLKNNINPMFQIHYERLYRFLEKNNFHIYCPITYKHCLAKAFLHGLRGPPKITDNTKRRKKENKRASKLMSKRTEVTCGEILNFFTTKYPNINLTVRNFKLEVIFSYQPIYENLTQYLRTIEPKEINMLVGRGHAFGLSAPFHPRTTPEPVNYGMTKKEFERVSKQKNEFLIKKVSPSLDFGEIVLGAFDIETTRGKSPNKMVLKTNYKVKPYALGFYVEGTGYMSWYGLDCIDQFVEKILGLKRGYKRKYVFYAHNGGGFDFLFVLKKLLLITGVRINKALDVKGALINIKMLYKDNWKNDKEKPLSIIFKDSCPIFSYASLDSLSKELDTSVKKLTGYVDHDSITKHNFLEHQKDVEKYLKNDVLSLYEIVIKGQEIFQKEYKVNMLNSATAASITRFHYLSQHYDPDNFPLYNFPMVLDQIFRKSYFGGRSDCFKIGVFGGPIYYYDVTSEYPSQLAENMPYGWPRFVSNQNKLDWDVDQGIYYVYVKGKAKNGLNVLPYRSKNGLIFPTFSDWTGGWWWSEELKLAREQGYGMRFVYAFVFKTAPYMKVCVEGLFAKKQKAKQDKNPALEKTAKIIINSLYGFWATVFKDLSKIILKTVSTPKQDPALKYLQTNTLLNAIRVGDTHVMRVKEDIRLSYSYAPISIACAAKSRIYLYKIIASVIERGGEVYYCDTDSLITNLWLEKIPYFKEKYMKNNGKNLGGLKNEFGPNQSANGLVTIAPKIYGFPNKGSKLKGFYKNKIYKRRVSLKKKTVFFSNPRNKDQQEKFPNHRGKGYDDLLLMAQGYKLQLTTWRFLTRTRACFDTFTIKKEPCRITFSNKYIKGRVEEDGKVIPWKIRPSLTHGEILK
jgi:hypothetical protein